MKHGRIICVWFLLSFFSVKAMEDEEKPAYQPQLFQEFIETWRAIDFKNEGTPQELLQRRIAAQKTRLAFISHLFDIPNEWYPTSELAKKSFGDSPALRICYDGLYKGFSKAATIAFINYRCSETIRCLDEIGGEPLQELLRTNGDAIECESSIHLMKQVLAQKMKESLAQQGINLSQSSECASDKDPFVPEWPRQSYSAMSDDSSGPAEDAPLPLWGSSAEESESPLVNKRSPSPLFVGNQRDALKRAGTHRLIVYPIARPSDEYEPLSEQRKSLSESTLFQSFDLADFVPQGSLPVKESPTDESADRYLWEQLNEGSEDEDTLPLLRPVDDAQNGQVAVTDFLGKIRACIGHLTGCCRRLRDSDCCVIQ